LKFFKLFLLLLSTQILWGQKVDVTADSMKAYDAKKEVHFTGNATVKQGKDWIKADEIIIHLNKKNQAEMYEALGHVTFEFQNEKGHYKGSSRKVKYYPLKSLYILLGRAKVKDIMNNRSAKGDKITVDMLTGNSQVKGSKKKPVKFTFDTGKK
jgi:lipopolysaccharide export system protein LptA